MNRRVLRALPFFVGVACLLLACGGLGSESAVGAPAWKGLDLLVCLDVSRSMLARDVAPDRLGYAKRQIEALAARAEGDRIGLVLFAGEARLRVPRTRDGASLTEMTREAGPWDVARGGTDLAAAVAAAHQALAARRGQGAVVILSDGGDLAPADVAGVAGPLQAEGIAVHALGIGSARGAKIPTEAGVFVLDAEGRDVVSALHAAGLRRLVDATGGTYRDHAADGLVRLYEEAILPTARRVGVARDTEDEGPAGTLLLLALLAFLLDGGFVMPRSRRVQAVVAGLVWLCVLPGCAESPPADAEARAMFLKGNQAFADSLALEEAGRGPRGDPEARKAAYRRAEDALAAWQWAAATRADWPEARRNVERGLLRMAKLRERKKDDGSKAPPPKPPPPEVDEPEDPRPNRLTRVIATELPPGGVLRILDTLHQRERQKIDLRKARRTRRPALGGRDW